VGQCVRMAAGISPRGRRTPDNAAQSFMFVASCPRTSLPSLVLRLPALWSAAAAEGNSWGHRCDRLLSGVKYVAPCSTACCIAARSQMRFSELAQKDRCHRVTVRQPCEGSALALPGLPLWARVAAAQGGCRRPALRPWQATVCTLVARVTSIENRRWRRRCRNSRRRMGTRKWRRL